MTFITYYSRMRRKKQCYPILTMLMMIYLSRYFEFMSFMGEFAYNVSINLYYMGAHFVEGKEN